jgi:hypothetical protein
MLLYTEDGGSRYIRNIRNYKHIDTSKKTDFLKRSLVCGLFNDVESATEVTMERYYMRREGSGRGLLYNIAHTI